eukprot:TRINITY_DN1002_c0_g1_i1.p1 TRINITY_DN1002_c0_g1~~TRINITY_DN1002_c0_g1_i1.p1  ORF type:complete len:1069 (+),score=408.29 TRINITY_DN1002_c0_g1_i1:220-3426(+)
MERFLIMKPKPKVDNANTEDAKKTEKKPSKSPEKEKKKSKSVKEKKEPVERAPKKEKDKAETKTKDKEDTPKKKRKEPEESTSKEKQNTKSKKAKVESSPAQAKRTSPRKHSEPTEEELERLVTRVDDKKKPEKKKTTAKKTKTPEKVKATPEKKAVKAEDSDDMELEELLQDEPKEQKKKATPEKKKTPEKKNKGSLEVEPVVTKKEKATPEKKPTPEKKAKEVTEETPKKVKQDKEPDTKSKKETPKKEAQEEEAPKKVTPKKETPTKPPTPKSTPTKESEKKATPTKTTPTKSAMKKDHDVGPSKKVQIDVSDDSDSKDEKATMEKKKSSTYFAYKNRGGPAMKGSKQIPQAEENCLFGKNFCVTGVLDSLEREEVWELVERYGGKVSKSITKSLTHLIVGEGAGEGKLNKARENKNLAVITEDDFLNLLATLPAKKLSADQKAKSKNVILPPSPDKAVSNDTPGKKSPKKSPNKAVELPSEPKPAVDPRYQLWADKYKPKTSAELVGNPTVVQNLMKWLKNYKVTTEINKAGKKVVSTPGKKAALLSGQPGIGKTSTAHLIALECGYEPVEFNASDARSKKAIKEHLDDLVGNRTMGEFFTAKNKPAAAAPAAPKLPAKKRKMCLIMDEVDGMSSGDRGGMAELILLIKKSTTPIICICNDRMSQKVRSLANYCEDFRFRKPTTQQAVGRIITIARKEGFRVEQLAVERLLESTQCDLRQTLNVLQMWRRNSSSFASTDENFKEKLDKAMKDIDRGIFEVVPKIFQAKVPLAAKFDYFYVDSSIIPLMVQENYLTIRSDSPNVMDAVSLAADSISMGNMIDRAIYSNQSWELSNAYALLSTIRPTAILGSVNASINGMLQFPSFLGKLSQMNKRKRLLTDIQLHSSTSLSGNKNELRLHYFTPLLQEIVTPILRDGADGIPDAIAVMDAYGINKDDFNSMLEIAQFGNDDFMKDVATNVKSAFTRQYNKSHQFAKRTSRKAGAEDEDEEPEAGAEGEAAQPSQDLSEDDDAADDKLISKKAVKINSLTPGKKSRSTGAKATSGKKRKKEEDSGAPKKKAKTTKK